MTNQRNSVRIIGGKWRGRKLGFPSFPDLRPTADRARETLFNWLAGSLDGAHCLDLFAGSGCLGFEALSRGAAHVTLVDVRSRVVDTLRETAARLHGATPDERAALEAQVTIARADARAWLAQAGDATYDLVFLDPPFAARLLAGLLPDLAPHLRAGALVYVELPADAPVPPLPDGWTVARESRVGGVVLRLLRIT